MGTACEETCLAPETEPLKYQTWVLKVSIHCQGCKRKVKKALQSMEGVYTASVDLQQQKVVVTGNVDSETLIKMLHKAGRHAEPWPEKPKKEKENGNKDNSTPNNNKDNGGGKGTNVSGKPRDKDPGPCEGGETKPAEETSTASAAKTAPNNADAPSKAALNDKSPCLKGGGRDFSMKSSEGKDGGSSPPSLEKPAAGGGNAEGHKANGGKKGKKGQKEGGIGSGGELASESSGDTGNVYSHFPSYPKLPLVYAVSYSTAYPSASSGAVYYATAPAVLPQQSVVYGARAQQHCPAYYYHLPVAGVFIPPSDTEGAYDVFSDENAHACRVM